MTARRGGMSRAADSIAFATLFAGAHLSQPLRHRLQELPGDRPVLFDERAELPESESVANKVGRGDDRGRTRSAVDQSNLAEIVARTERGNLDTSA